MLCPMLIHDWDRPIDDDEWRAFVAANSFGHLVASGADRDVPVVVPTQFVFGTDAAGGEVRLHLARQNPIFAAIDENPRVVMSIAGDWAYIRTDWKAGAEEDPRSGIPTTYYAAVQLIGTAHVVDDAPGVASVLAEQLADVQPDVEVVDPIEHGKQLNRIRGLLVEVTEVRAKFKYGGNLDDERKERVHHLLIERDGPGDRAAARHARRRL